MSKSLVLDPEYCCIIDSHRKGVQTPSTRVPSLRTLAIVNWSGADHNLVVSSSHCLVDVAMAWFPKKKQASHAIVVFNFKTKETQTEMLGEKSPKRLIFQQTLLNLHQETGKLPKVVQAQPTERESATAWDHPRSFQSATKNCNRGYSTYSWGWKLLPSHVFTFWTRGGRRNEINEKYSVAIGLYNWWYSKSREKKVLIHIFRMRLHA